MPISAGLTSDLFKKSLLPSRRSVCPQYVWLRHLLIVPADLRKLRAVDPPSLRHHRNCIGRVHCS